MSQKGSPRQRGITALENVEVTAERVSEELGVCNDIRRDGSSLFCFRFVISLPTLLDKTSEQNPPKNQTLTFPSDKNRN